MEILKPKLLKRGDVIGIIAPASPPSDEQSLNRGIEYLEKLGYRIVLGKHVSDRYGYLAGKDVDRANELNDFFSNKNIKAIFVLRGGYGSSRILPYINYNLIKRNPKIFVGYSDITAIHLALYKKCRMLTFSGPMLEPDFSKKIAPNVEELFWRLLTSNSPIENILSYSTKSIHLSFNKKIYGRIIGGNLSIITSLIGTQYFPELKDKILILEDIDERPYRIDRMLTQLKLSGNLKRIKCIVLGDFSSCIEKKNVPSLKLDEIFKDVLREIPLVQNFEFGHLQTSLPIPFGIKIEISENFLRFVEPAVVS